MSSEELELDLVDTLARVRDCLYGAGEVIDKFVQAKAKAATKDYDVSKIQWVEAEGQHGKYEKTDDVNNADYKLLRKDLADHKGKLTHEGLFFWVFQNGVTIGRKKANYPKREKV